MIRGVILFLVTLLPIQKGDGFRCTISGTIFCQEGGKANIPLGGATISLIAGKDTLNTVSNNSGKFSFSLPQTFEVTIIAHYQGFEDYRETYQLLGNHTAIAIRMKQSRQQLDAAKIESEIPFVRTDADTVIYNMAALEKMEGDRALDLLMQIPGFGTYKGKLTVWGEYVDKTYINGKLIYGDDPMSALSLLKAEEIKNVRVYDTQHMADKHRGVKNSKKRRVIDVQTFQQFLSAVDLQAQSRAGTISKKVNISPLRFSSGFDFDSNREMRQIGVYVNGNTIDDKKNGIEVTKNAPPMLFSDKMYASASCKFVKKWDDAEWGNSLSLNYGYFLNTNRLTSETVINRMKTGGGQASLHYEENSHANSRTGTHVAAIGAKLHKGPIKDIDFYLGVSFDDFLTGESKRLSSDTGSTGVQYQDQTSGIMDRAFSISPVIRWSKLDAKNGWMPSVSFSSLLSNSYSSSFTVDTLKSSTTRRYLEGNGGGKNRNFSGAVSLKKTLTNTNRITAELELIGQANYTDEHKSVMTLDCLLPEGEQTDFTNSFDYSWNDLKLSVGAGFSIASPTNQLLFFRAGVVSDRQLDIEAFPTDVRASHCFSQPYTMVYITPPLREGRLVLGYALAGETPSLEQTRKRVDNRNPLRLRVGNPDLKAPLKHTVGLTYVSHVSSQGSFFSFQSEFVYKQNPIVDKIQYFSQPGELNEWGVDYHIPAGVTLTGYENTDHAFSVFSSASYSMRVKQLKGTFKSELRFDIRKLPEYDDEYLNSITGYGPKLNLSLSTMPIKPLRLSLTSETSYTKDINSFGTVISELVLESCSLSAEIRFLKHGFCDTRYSVNIYKYLSGMGINMDIQNLSCALGAFFLDGKLAVSVSGNDLLGKALNYSTRTTSSEFVRHSGTSLGRYCLLNIAYRFSNKK